LNKGDKPYTARDLVTKLGKVWKMVHKWKMVPLGWGYYDFLFEQPEDIGRIWTDGTVSLQRNQAFFVSLNGQRILTTILRNRHMLHFGSG